MVGQWCMEHEAVSGGTRRCPRFLRLPHVGATWVERRHVWKYVRCVSNEAMARRSCSTYALSI
eukprot:54106-Eustigmatos_ZCMA.PRE.1